MNEFYSEAEEIISRVSATLSRLETYGLSDDLIDGLYRDIHTLKGTAQLFGFTNIGLISHAIEACLEPIRSKRISPSKKLLSNIYLSLDFIDRNLKGSNDDSKADSITNFELNRLIANLSDLVIQIFLGHFQLYKNHYIFQDNLNSIKSYLLSNETEESLKGINNSNLLLNDQQVLLLKDSDNFEPHPFKVKNETEFSDLNTIELSTIRVQTGLLDCLMNLVGEMVLIRNQVLQYRSKNNSSEFLNLSQRLNLVTSELQENVMKTRMQPIGSILNKFQRVVRDLSLELNKKIKLVIQGSDTELDKGLLELIKDPLNHIIRNSCDHGIESTEERLIQNKPIHGIILIHAFHESGQVIIEISDDGRGLNFSKILSKSIKKNIISAEKSNVISDREIGLLIFEPGFSTVDHVSTISGRGVGMDVVKTNLEKVGGFVDLSSISGKGTKVRLSIPLTLAIVPAMIVISDKQLFAIPQVKLQELVRIDMNEDGPKVEFLEGLPILRRREKLLPIVFLNNILRNNENLVLKEINLKVINIVVLSFENDQFGLVVDEIQDTADIVVKPLPQFLKRINLFSGATILGDGTISLIIDVIGVAEKAKIQRHLSPNAKSKIQTPATTTNNQLNVHEFLFFDLNDGGKYCLPLILVHRLEEFTQEQIETSGMERIVKYRKSILPIINLNNFLKLAKKNDFKEEEKISIIVIAKRNRLIGIEVNKILDVLKINAEIENPIKFYPGILGNIIIGSEVATVIDALNIIDVSIEGANLRQKPFYKKNKNFNSSRAIKILFVEDTPFFINQIKKILLDLEIEVVHASDGQEALEILKSSKPECFDLILSDIEMPRMNGYQLAENVRKESLFKKIPMIAVTTRYNESDIERGLKAGFNQYLEKLSADQLVDAIKTQLGDVTL